MVRLQYIFVMYFFQLKRTIAFHILSWRSCHLVQPCSLFLVMRVAWRLMTLAECWTSIQGKRLRCMSYYGCILHKQLLSNKFIIEKPKQAGTCGRSMKHHPRCQISIYVQFSLWCKVILHKILKVKKLNTFNIILYQYRLVILHMIISYAPPTSASLFWFYYS